MKIKADDSKIRNELHFNAQLSMKAAVFVDRKKRFKNGYRKHKKYPVDF